MPPPVGAARRTLNHWVSPGLLAGARPAMWQRLRGAHGVDARYRLRALVTSFATRETERWAIQQRERIGDLSDVEVREPLFVLGHYRSGTTLLHGLLARDPRFHAPTLLETLYPSSFVAAEQVLRRRLRLALPATRVYDAVAVSADMPMEDEFAVAALSGCSHLLRYAFPRDWDTFERFLTLEHAADRDVDAWRGAMRQVTRTLTRLHGARLVLKSPPHTAKVPHLLALFPDARFVFVRRHPFEVYTSMQRMLSVAIPAATFHARASWPDLERAVTATFREMARAYLDARASIPAGRLVEVAYDDLTSDLLATLGHVYGTLDLGPPPHLPAPAPFTPAPPVPLPTDLRRRLARDWSDAFDAWDYQA